MNFVIPGIARKVQEQPHVLIATCYQDLEFSRKLALALRRDRVSSHVDVGEMTAGDSLFRRLTSATRPIDCVVPVISIPSLAHDWVEREVPELLTGDTGERRVKTYPAKVDNCTLPPALRGRFVIDFYGRGWGPGYDAVRAAIQGKPGAERPAPKQAAPRPVKRAPLAGDAAQPASKGKQLYLSFDHENDGYCRELLETWSRMPGFAQFWVNDPPALPADSDAAEPVKQALAKRIGAASGFLCVIGANSSTNRWMEWEIRKADELGKRIIAVRVNRDVAVPELLSDVGATCAMSFTFEGIRRAIDEAYGGLPSD
jgi:hypothetical protein